MGKIWKFYAWIFFDTSFASFFIAYFSVRKWVKDRGYISIGNHNKVSRIGFPKLSKLLL